MRDRRDLSAAWTLADEVCERVRRAGQQRVADAWLLLEELVNVDSSPDDLPGLDRVVALVEAELAGLGLTTTVERTSAGLPVLHARRLVDPDRTKASVLFVGHLDTVFPPGTVASWPMRRTGETATGPGIADAKGGAVVAWLALAAALDGTDGLPGLDLRVLLNTDEEAGSVESRPIIERAAEEADLALIYEPGRPDGSIVRQRRGARRYRITVQGKAAHTGVEPWNGVNAVEEAAHKIVALQALNDPDRFLSVTVAVAHGGTRINVVPDAATLDVDTRLPDLETARQTHDAVETIVRNATVPGASASYEIVSDRPPLTPQPAVPALLDRFRHAARVVGFELSDTATGGGSDGCFLSPLGVPTIDALGPVGGGYHTRDEFIRADTLLERSVLNGLVLASLASG